MTVDAGPVVAGVASPCHGLLRARGGRRAVAMLAPPVRESFMVKVPDGIQMDVLRY